MQRVIVTGANGAGKSHVAASLRDARPDIPLVSFDSMKLKRDWHQRPRSEIDTALGEIVKTDAWILEGGPSLLSRALPRAEAVIWLDPPELVRAWRLMSRPWRNFGKTRPELPAGNTDWPLQQYKFAFRSLKNRSNFISYIATTLEAVDGLVVWRCKTQHEVEAAVEMWR